VKRPFFVVILILLLVGLASCPNSSGGELLYSIDLYSIDPPEKIPPNSGSLVRNALFIDTGQLDAAEILAGAGNYVLAESGSQYFDWKAGAHTPQQARTVGLAGYGPWPSNQPTNNYFAITPFSPFP
jgi:hypothetical protein